MRPQPTDTAVPAAQDDLPADEVDNDSTLYEHLRIQADKGQALLRVDKFLFLHLQDTSRNRIQKAAQAGFIRVNDRPVKSNYRVKPFDSVTVWLDHPPYETKIEPENIPLDIVYEDQDVIVVNKPRGLVVHPAPGHADGTLVNALLWHCGDSLSGIGGEKRPGIVHRIDKDTSGLLIAAKNDFAHQRLAAQLEAHSLYRVYEAVVRGGFREDSGTVDRPIGRHPTDRKRMAVTEKNGRRAVTHWEVLERYRDYTHVRCRLETGRTHQIRVHMASLGHPLLGDGVYGAPCPEKGLEGQCLHARALRFIHPRSGEEITLECPLPPYFLEVLGRLGPTLS